MSIDAGDEIDQEAPETEAATSRRHLVTKGIVAAAVAAVATGGLTKSVHATNGDTMFVGVGTNSATATTSITGGSTFRVVSGETAGNSSIYGTAAGDTNSWFGVRGDNTGSIGAGVYGRMVGSAGTGVIGEASLGGTAVYGTHTGTSSGVGVHGTSGVGIGVAGSSNIDLAAIGSGRVRLSAVANPALASTATGAVGTIARDAAGSVWYCYATNKWHKLAGPTTAGAFNAIAPKRVYDSRAGQAPLGVTKGKLNTGQTRVVDCTFNGSGVPATAKAVVLNLTAANTTGPGNLAVYPNGTPAPTTSSINYTAGVNIANSTTSGCGAGAKLTVKAGGSAGADFIVDIVGYYE